MGRKADGTSSTLRDELALRIEVAEFLEDARMQSKYATNLSAAARAADISPSYLHKIEGGEVMASAEVYTRLCRVLGIPAGPVLRKIGKLDPDLEDRLLARIDVMYDLLDALLRLPEERLRMIASGLLEHGDGKEEQHRERVEDRLIAP